ncbi:fumarylacetoacetate hydrolase family protein [Nocardia sp. Marseille-Q1738]
MLGADAPPTAAALLAVLPKTRERLTAALAAVDHDPDRALQRGSLLAADEVTLHAPLGERTLLLCTGGNFRSHLAEMGEQPPERIPWAIKSPNAVVGTGEPLVLPAGAPHMVDFEGELAIVFGRPAHAVSAADAMAYIGGYTILNDVSDRSSLREIGAARTPAEGRWAWVNMLAGKQYPSFSPLGPAILTADEVPDPADLRLSTTLNGVVMQDASLAELAVDIPHLVEQLSAQFSFLPGDIVTTGTPAGVGVARTPPVFLRPGDTITVEVGGIGALTNPVIGGV